MRRFPEQPWAYNHAIVFAIRILIGRLPLLYARLFLFGTNEDGKCSVPVIRRDLSTVKASYLDLTSSYTNRASMTHSLTRIATIGAGTSGLAQLKQMLDASARPEVKSRLEVVLYESRGEVGGVW